MLQSQGMELLLLIAVQLIYVPLLTLRTITMVKNLRVLAAIFGFLEAFVYVFGLAIVFSGEQSTLQMLVYALGFSLGLIAGVYVEQKLAIGFTSVHVNISQYNPELVEKLRESGYGVTAFDAYGKTSSRVRLDILTHRRNEKKLTELILSFEPQAFIVSYEPKTFRGGYMTQLMRRRMANLPKKPVDQVAEEEHSIFTDSLTEVKREIEVLQKDWQNDGLS